jgi:hypothetical protein
VWGGRTAQGECLEVRGSEVLVLALALGHGLDRLPEQCRGDDHLAHPRRLGHIVLLARSGSGSGIEGTFQPQRIIGHGRDWSSQSKSLRPHGVLRGLVEQQDLESAIRTEDMLTTLLEAV